MAERLDDLQNGYRIYQDPASFCFGIDAVLLSHYAKARPGDKVLDLGCGNGTIPLIMAACSPDDVTFTGIEIQKEAAGLAEKSILYNGLEDRIRIVSGDLRLIGQEACPKSGTPDNSGSKAPVREVFEIRKGSYQIVTCNPPYYAAGSGRLSEASSKAAARHELLCTLEDVVRAASYALCHRGQFYMIHIPERLPEILASLTKHSLQPAAMRFVHPSFGKAPTMVLISAVKDGRCALKVEAPLYVYDSGGQYTEEVRRIYEGGNTE